MATIFDNDILKFAKIFVLFDTYKISNAKITPLAEKYNKFGYPYQWVINSRTAVSRDLGNVIPRSGVHLDFASMSEISVDSVSHALKDVLVVVIERLPLRTLNLSGVQHNIREFAVVNQEKRPLIMSLWNTVAESEGSLIDIAFAELGMPVIRATRLSVSSYYGVSLASTPTTSVTVNPEINEAAILRNWRTVNQAYIADVLARKDYLVQESSFKAIVEKDIYPVSDIVGLSDLANVVVRAKLKITNTEQNFFYMACDHCFSGINAEFNYSYTCSNCMAESVAKPRAMLFVNMYDLHGSLDVVIFGDNVAKILQVNCTMTMELHNLGECLNIGALNLGLADETFNIRLRMRHSEMRHVSQTQYIITSLQSDRERNKSPTAEEAVPTEGEIGEDISQKTSTSRELFP